jgi:hypothetical protein
LAGLLIHIAGIISLFWGLTVLGMLGAGGLLATWLAPDPLREENSSHFLKALRHFLRKSGVDRLKTAVIFVAIGVAAIFLARLL